jgi:hypothetical protein
MGVPDVSFTFPTSTHCGCVCATTCTPAGPSASAALNVAVTNVMRAQDTKTRRKVMATSNSARALLLKRAILIVRGLIVLTLLPFRAYGGGCPTRSPTAIRQTRASKARRAWHFSRRACGQSRPRQNLRRRCRARRAERQLGQYPPARKGARSNSQGPTLRTPRASAGIPASRSCAATCGARPLIDKAPLTSISG